METSMKEKCIRCKVNVHFSEVEWQDSAGVSVILEGPSVFVRACVLGQLQYSHLHTPTFPVTVNQTLTFDRVLTNCRTLGLFKEVIRGEHVKLELIQVSSDFRGGKILARFDTPAHKFLFPECPNGDLQQLVMDKARRETKEHKTSYRVKFKPPVPKFPKSASSKQTQSLLPTTHSPLMSSELFQSTTAKLGPHQWVECPRRSPKRQRSLSAPSSPVRRAKRANSENIRPLSADFDDFLALLDLEDPQEEVMDTRPPFVVRRIDQHLMGRRDFCGCSRTKNKESKMSKSDASRSERKQSARIVPAYLNESIQMSHDDYTTTDHSGTLSRSLISSFKQRPHSVQFTTPIDTPTLSKPTTHCSNGKQELLSKYQVAGSSHVRRGVYSPRRAIEEKIERLTAECYDFKVSSVLR